MTIRNVVLTEELDAFVSSMVEGGYYADADEVVRAALHGLEREDRTKQQNLENALDEGEQSGLFAGDAFASVRREMGWEEEA